MPGFRLLHPGHVLTQPHTAPAQHNPFPQESAMALGAVLSGRLLGEQTQITQITF